MGPRLRRCARRLIRAEALLRWVLAEADLSGNMELVAAIRAFLGHV